jgi:ferredoxin
MEMKLEQICEYVGAGKEGYYETRGPGLKMIYAPLLVALIKPQFHRRYENLAKACGRTFDELVPLADRSFLYDEKCNGCGICARVCPADNIKLAGGRPEWQHHCENCNACYVWCPKGAISGEIVSYSERCHHPGVKLADMLRIKEPPASVPKEATCSRGKTTGYREVTQ